MAGEVERSGGRWVAPIEAPETSGRALAHEPVGCRVSENDTLLNPRPLMRRGA